MESRAGQRQRARVLLVSSSFPRWTGDSTTPFILHLARDLRALGWDVHVLAPHAPGAARQELIDGVPVERFRYFWPESQQTVCYQGGALINLRRAPHNLFKVPFLVMSEWAGLLRRLSRRSYDLVHSHWLLPQGFTAGLAASLFHVPHVATIHGGDVFALTGAIPTACKKIALKLADVVTVNSSATLDATRRLAPRLSRIVRIPMGATEAGPPDPEAVAQLQSRYRRGSGPLLLFVGRLVEEKGVADVLRALSLVRESLPHATALIVGEGQERQRFESLAAELGIRDRVGFTGWIDSKDLPAYFAAADVFVGPSKRSPQGWIEAQGLTFIEAMLARVPVIATRAGGITDAVLDGETGLLVSESAPQEIASAVLRLHADPALRDHLRTRGWELARREFTREASARAFAALFAEMLRDRPPDQP